MTPRKTINAAKFTVCLRQNNSDGFTINGFSRILSSHIRTTKFCVKCPCATLDKKHELEYLEKYAMLSRVFKFVMKLNSLGDYFRGNVFAYGNRID